MATEVGSAVISLLPSARGFQSKLQRELAGPSAAEGQRAGQTAGTRFSSGFASTVSRGARRMFAPIIGGAIRAGKYLTVAGGAAAIFGLKTAASLEQSDVAFTTMLGSARKAHKFLLQLQAFARKTPFEFTDVVTASQRLLAFGFSAKQVLPTLTAIGDAAAGLGAGAEGVQRITLAIGQIQAKGKVQSDELLQLTEQGIPALKILANGFGVTTGKMQKMVTKGVVPANKAIPLLLKGIEKGTDGLAGKTAKFGGLMDKQSHTLGGIFSNIVDTVSQGLAKTVKPLLPVLERELPAAMPVLQRGFSAVGGGLRQLLTGLGLVKDRSPGAASGLERFGRTIADEVFPALKHFMGNAGRFADALAPMIGKLGKLAGGAIVGGIKTLDKVMGFLADHAGLAQTALAGIAGLAIGKKLAGIGSALFGGKGGGLLDKGGSPANPLYVFSVNGGGGAGVGGVDGKGKSKTGRFGGLFGGAVSLLALGNLFSNQSSLPAGTSAKDRALHGVGDAMVFGTQRGELGSDKLPNGLVFIDRDTGLSASTRAGLDRKVAHRQARRDRKENRNAIRELLFGPLDLSKGAVSRIFAPSPQEQAYKHRIGSALQDARLTKLERLVNATAVLGPVPHQPSTSAPRAGQHFTPDNWINRTTGAPTIIVRGDLRVDGVDAQSLLQGVNRRHRTRALSGGSTGDPYVPHGA